MPTALASEMMGLGMPAPLATLIGDAAINSVTGVGTALAGSAVLALGINLLTTAGGNTAFHLPSTAPLSDPVLVVNLTSTTALLFPPDASSTIIYAAAQSSAGASVNIVQWAVVEFFRVSATSWVAMRSDKTAT